MGSVLVGDVGTETLKTAVRAGGVAAARNFFRTAGGAVVRRTIDAIILQTAQKVAAAFGIRTGVWRVFGAVPVIGSVINFSVDGGMCYGIAKTINWVALHDRY